MTDKTDCAAPNEQILAAGNIYHNNKITNVVCHYFLHYQMNNVRRIVFLICILTAISIEIN